MASGGIKCTRIFFKDKKNELKGPYTERQVQEWYRDGWFENSFPFYFLGHGISQDDSSLSFTLDELCTRNGIGAPFCLPSESLSSEKIRAQTEQKLDCIEEEIRSLRVKCEDVLRVKERLSKIEEKIKSLPAKLLQSTNAKAASVTSEGLAAETEEKKIPKTVKKLVEQRDRKREAELCKFKMWAEFYSDFYIAYLDCLQTEDFRRLTRNFKEATLEQATLIMENVEAYSMFTEKIIEKMKKREDYSCTLCDFLPYNYKQWFLHSIDWIHVSNEKTIGQAGVGFAKISQRLASNIASKFKAEQDIFSKEIAKKYASVSLSKSVLQSRIAFAACVNHRYQTELHEQSQIALANGATPWTTEHECVLFSIRELYKGRGVAAKLVAELDAHMGTEMTYCLDCKVVTGTREEYYKHLMTYNHLMRVDRTHTLFYTMAVNLHRTDLVD